MTDVSEVYLCPYCCTAYASGEDAVECCVVECCVVEPLHRYLCGDCNDVHESEEDAEVCCT